MKVKIILNPYANRWRARDRVSAIEDAFRDTSVNFELTFTQMSGHAKQEAMLAVDNGFDAVVAAGGDGTVSEVVNGLIESSGDRPTFPLGVLPVGTGNDFNDMNALPRELRDAAQVIASGKTRQIDAGRVEADGQIHYFDNNCALAMEPVVTIENIRLKHFKGPLRYIVATLIALTKLEEWQMQINWDEGHYEGPVYLLSICNSPRTGGLFLMAPTARVNDGILDFVIAPKMPKPAVLAMVPRLLNGSHIEHRRILHGRTNHLSIKSEPGTPIHADGEVIATSARHIIYDVLPGKITLLGPESE